LFQISIYLIVVINAVIMALDRYPEPEFQAKVFDLLNQVFSWIFVAEMMIKLAGLGVREYIRDNYNIFDAFIVFLSVVDNLLYYSIGNNVGGGGFIILRSIRLLRIVKLARSWTSFRHLIEKI
jgi:Ion transport protein